MRCLGWSGWTIKFAQQFMDPSLLQSSGEQGNLRNLLRVLEAASAANQHATQGQCVFFGCATRHIWFPWLEAQWRKPNCRSDWESTDRYRWYTARWESDLLGLRTRSVGCSVAKDSTPSIPWWWQQGLVGTRVATRTYDACAVLCAVSYVLKFQKNIIDVQYVQSHEARPHSSASICECDKLFPHAWEASADFAMHDEARICFSSRFQVV